MPARTLRSDTLGRIKLRLVERDDGRLAAAYWTPDGKRVLVDPHAGETVGRLWERLSTAALRSDTSFFGYDGAVSRFLDVFPDGFRDPAYLGKERDHKVEAARLLNDVLPLDAAAADDADGVADAAQRVYAGTSLVDRRWEQPPLLDLLRGSDGDRLVRHTARFALGQGRQLAAVAAICARHGLGSKWPVATCLPFLWTTPAEHALLRKGPATAFATRVGHAFASAYRADLSLAVYHAYLDLLAATRAAIAELEPRDAIDVQSFVWVVSRYAP